MSKDVIQPSELVEELYETLKKAHMFVLGQAFKEKHEPEAHRGDAIPLNREIEDLLRKTAGFLGKEEFNYLDDIPEDERLK